MNKEDILKAIKEVREKSKKRNFKQTFDLIINLKQLNLKKPEDNINTFVVLKHNKGKKTKVCALVDKELSVKAKEVCDQAILRDEFTQLDKKKLKKLASSYDFFIAQATLMTDVAKFFGKVLGPKGKMPNPKAGCIVPPTANLEQVYERLQKTIKLQTKNELILKCPLGKEELPDEEIKENILTVYNSLLSVLPQEKNNIKNLMLKLTMSSPVLIGGKDEESS